MKGPKRRRANASGRNEGEQFLPLPYATTRCDAWRSLSGPGVKVWVELRSRYNGGNNGKLSLSWDEAVRLLGLGKGTVGRAFEELQEKGFGVIVRRGRWYGRLATEWRLTDLSCDGHPPTKDYLKWHKPLKARKSEVGFSADHIEAMMGQP
jgi:hypothetical protein